MQGAKHEVRGGYSARERARNSCKEWGN